MISFKKFTAFNGTTWRSRFVDMSRITEGGIVTQAAIAGTIKQTHYHLQHWQHMVTDFDNMLSERQLFSKILKFVHISICKTDLTKFQQISLFMLDYAFMQYMQ